MMPHPTANPPRNCTLREHAAMVRKRHPQVQGILMDNVWATLHPDDRAAVSAWISDQQAAHNSSDAATRLTQQPSPHAPLLLQQIRFIHAALEGAEINRPCRWRANDLNQWPCRSKLAHTRVLSAAREINRAYARVHHLVFTDWMPMLPGDLAHTLRFLHTGNLYHPERNGMLQGIPTTNTTLSLTQPTTRAQQRGEEG